MSQSRLKLGDILVAHKIISKDQLDWALRLQDDGTNPLTSILVENGFVGEDLLLQLMAAQENVAAWHLEKDRPTPEALSKLPGAVCLQYGVLPVRLTGDLLTIAMRNPSDLEAIEVIRQASGLRVEPVLASEDRLIKMIDYLFGERHDGVNMDTLVDQAMAEIDFNHLPDIRSGQALTEEDTRPVVGLVNQILTDAIRLRASDIHVEPRANGVDLRFRLDGQLVKVREIPSALHPMLVTRIKIMGEMDIVEYRLPQDGRIQVQLEGRNVDLRVSVLPNVHGQRIVLRVLDKAVALKKLDELGFSTHSMSLFRGLVRKPYGLLLVTGPTGSGKTTTLYAALNELRNVATNIMTCEDPVEYELPGINQSQINDKIGLTFAAQLRAILRQDPDIILVGEIRDEETAQTAIRASLTGHLVLSTLHCNDAPSAIPRLLDMGIDPYLLSTSLIGVTAQRLVRRLCPDCQVAEQAEGEDLSLLIHYLGADVSRTIYRSLGCAKCYDTGYRGRIAIQELMPVTSRVSEQISKQAPIDAVRQIAESNGFRTMQHDVLERVISGQTSMNEARRVVFFESKGPTGFKDDWHVAA